MEVISSTLIHFECSAPHFIDEKESYSLIKALNSTCMEGIILHGHRSWQNLSLDITSLGVGLILDIEQLGLTSETMTSLLLAIESGSSQLQILNLNGNSFDENTWNALYLVCTSPTKQNLRALGLGNINFNSEAELEIFTHILQSPVVLNSLEILDMSKMYWEEELDGCLWNYLPDEIYERTSKRTNFTLKLNEILTYEIQFDKLHILLENLQCTELHVDNSSFVTETYLLPCFIETLGRYDRLLRLSMKTKAEVIASNESILMLTTLRKLEALRLPMLLDHIFQALCVVVQEHESLCFLESQFSEADKLEENCDNTWNALNCHLACRRMYKSSQCFHDKPFTNYLNWNGKSSLFSQTFSDVETNFILNEENEVDFQVRCDKSGSL